MPLRGVLLGFSPEIQQAPGITFSPGDSPGINDLNMRTGRKGLLYTYISGFEPLGPIEEGLLSRLSA